VKTVSSDVATTNEQLFYKISQTECERRTYSNNLARSRAVADTWQDVSHKPVVHLALLNPLRIVRSMGSVHLALKCNEMSKTAGFRGSISRRPLANNKSKTYTTRLKIKTVYLIRHSSTTINMYLRPDKRDRFSLRKVIIMTLRPILYYNTRQRKKSWSRCLK